MNQWIPVPLPPGLYGVALTTALIAAYYDIRWRRIPNWLVLAGLVTGLAGNLALGGAQALLWAALGMGMALLLYFPLYLLRGMGAGDVKLMAALGATLGLHHWLILALMASVLSVVAGLTLASVKGKMRKTLLNFGFIVRELMAFRVPYRSKAELDMHHEGAIRTPHGVWVAVGTVALVALTVLHARG